MNMGNILKKGFTNVGSCDIIGISVMIIVTT